MTESHDAIPKDLPKIGKTRLIAILVAVLVVFAGLFLIGYLPYLIHEKRLARQAQEMAKQPPIVDVVVPRATQQTVQLPLPGDAHAMQATALYARVNGYLKRRLVDIGDHVKAGQLLAEIDAPDVDAQLNEARAALEQANSRVISAQIDLELAQTTYTRYKGLVPTGGVTQQDLDTRETQLNQAVATKVGAIASVKLAQATVQRLEAEQGFEKIVAPFDGIITVRNYDVGALMSSSDTAAGHEMFDVAETDIIRVLVNVPQSYVSAIQIDQPVTFQVPNEPGRQFIGRVARWAGALDPTTRTMLTELHFDNRDGRLYAGMYGEVRFDIHREKPVLTVPTGAMLLESNGTQVAVVQKDDRVHFQKVSVGRDMGTEIEVLVGLNGNERVISNPGSRLVEGLVVRAHEEAAVAEASPPATQPNDGYVSGSK